MRRALAVALCALVMVMEMAACSRPVTTARTTHAQPPMPAETAARERHEARRCDQGWGLLFPGLGQLCLGKRAEGSALMALGAAELGTAVAVGRSQGWDHPGAAVPLLGLQDLWVYGNADVYIERALASQALYAPQDSLADMLAAPFNVQVLGRAEVWAGTLVVLGLGIGATLLIDGTDTAEAGQDPNLFGREVDRRVGYPLGVLTGAGLFSHVAIAEEALFRGVIQSGLARSLGETQGWLWGSLIFGLTHSLNALVLPPEDRKAYLLYAVPFITAAGAYLGHAYRRADYNLSVPVAIHFWYDLLLSTTFFVLEPKTSPLSASIRFQF
jgi:membrane protease YdiL (CAAX protease family)